MRGSRWGSPPIRMVPPAVAFLLGCTSGGTVSVMVEGHTNSSGHKQYTCTPNV